MKRSGQSTQSEDEALEVAVRGEQVRSLFDKGLAALATNVINACVLVAVLWAIVPVLHLLGWLAAMVAVVTIRAIGWGTHRRAPEKPYDVQRWMRMWMVGTAVTGALWGSTVIFLFPQESLGGRFLVLFLVGGMVAGASASMSGFLPAFIVFTAPALTPVVARLALENDPAYRAMALLMLIFGAGMTAVARTGGRALTQSIRLGLRNAQLLDELSINRDRLTELNRELEERVAARTEELRRALAENENFVTMVSHELRNPLQAMKLKQDVMVSMLRAPAVERAKLESVASSLRQQITRVERLSEDLIDVRRLATDRMHYNKEPVDLAQIVSESLEQLTPELSTAGARFELDCEPGLQGDWDRNRIEQVFINLFSNALKYGAPPFGLSARRSGGMAHVVVQDNGPGIPEKDLGRIFDPFERAAGGGVGLGLGLYISSQIVRAHHGTLRAASPAGAGASFIVELPLREE